MQNRVRACSAFSVIVLVIDVSWSRLIAAFLWENLNQNEVANPACQGSAMIEGDVASSEIGQLSRKHGFCTELVERRVWNQAWQA
jgi:hypothetical protein